MLFFIITLPSYFLCCLEMLMNHSSMVISDGFGEASSMLVPVSCLLALQPATGSHQSCTGINNFTFPCLTYLLSGSVWLLSFLDFLPSFQLSLCCAFKMHQRGYNTSFTEQKAKRWNDLIIFRKEIKQETENRFVNSHIQSAQSPPWHLLSQTFTISFP